MEHKILSFSFIFGAMAILFLSLISPTKAYGYTTSDDVKEISIDKKVRSIGDTQYYDNIESSVETFYENDVIEFQINVKNTSDKALNNINVKDILPKYLSLVFYPGTFNADQNIVEWNIDTLASGESKPYLIRAKINNSTSLNVLTKQTNKAETGVDGKYDSDNASYFIGKVSVPATGASDIMLKTGLVISLAGLGFGFRKKARGY